MSNAKVIKNYTAGAALTKYRAVKYDSSDGVVIPAAAATDAIIGVTTLLDAASGERADVIEFGIAEMEAGGTITRGALITSDASGKAVAASPGAGANNRIIGRAEVSAVLGDIFSVFVNPGQIQG